VLYWSRDGDNEDPRASSESLYSSSFLMGASVLYWSRDEDSENPRAFSGSSWPSGSGGASGDPTYASAAR
jgi:hypothetical protein